MSKRFNGTTDLISLGSPAALDNIGGVNGPRSVAVWINPAGYGEGGFGRIWHKGVDAGSTGWFLILDNVSGTARIRFDIAATTNAQGISVNNTISLNTWQFVAATWLGTIGTNVPDVFRGTLSTAVAEVSYATNSAGTGTQASDAADSGWIGNRSAADRTFDGLIAHLSVWDQALTLDQLDMLRLFPYAPMHRFATAAGVVINLKGYWPLWESAAATCLDHSGNGNNGTVTGTSVGAEPPFTFTRRGAQSTIWTPASVVPGVPYNPWLHRGPVLAQ